jgi:hypothetical protein
MDVRADSAIQVLCGTPQYYRRYMFRLYEAIFGQQERKVKMKIKRTEQWNSFK